MKKIILPGFASRQELFQNFISLDKDIHYISLEKLDYTEASAALDRLTADGEKLHIFAWSLGSLFALKWACSHNRQIASLFLTGATARFCEKEGYDNGITAAKLEQMLKLISRNPKLVLTNFYHTALEYVNDSQTYIQKLLDPLPEASALTAGLKSLQEIDILVEVKTLETPVFIYHGKNDKITPLKGTEVLHGLLPCSELKTFEGGHAPFLEQTKECYETWSKFLCTVN